MCMCERAEQLKNDAGRKDARMTGLKGGLKC